MTGSMSFGTVGRRGRNILGQLAFRRHLSFALIINTVIGFILSFVLRDPLFNSLVFSHVIGLCIFGAVQIYGRFFHYRPATLVIPLLLGSLSGLALAVLISAGLQGISLAALPALLLEAPRGLVVSLVLALGFGSLALYLIISKLRGKAAQLAWQAERFKRLEGEKLLAEAQLRLLQAQVEPHFLFNTLSNIAATMEVAPQTSRQLLEELTRYLRAVLRHSRNRQTTLEQELDLLAHYLALHRIRMGERLHYAIHVPDELKSFVLPPMLLQPLVENAIKHGIEPAELGGRIMIHGQRGAGKVRLSVTDTGLGLQQSAGSGFGIANIRERLQILYGDSAGVEVRENPPHGVVSILEVPDAPR